MKNRQIIASLITSFGIMLGIAAGNATAQMSDQMNETLPSQTGRKERFKTIEQPLSNKIIVTIGGLGLIGLELWWFLGHKSKSRQAIDRQDIQELTITVDGGYEPSQIVVRSGQKVRLNFLRQDASSCLEEIRFPEFQIDRVLTLNQVTPIEFTPQKPGKYEFTCGMNMFRGVVEVVQG